MMPNETVRNNFKKLLHSYVVREIESGNAVPLEVTDYLLAGYIEHVGGKSNKQYNQEKLDDFLESFEQYIQGFIKKEGGMSKPKRRSNAYVSATEQCIARYNSVISEKRKQLQRVHETLKKLFTMRSNYQTKFEEVVNAKCLSLDVSELRKELLRDKIMSSLLNETSHSREAFMKLKSLIEAEKKEVDKRLEFLEEEEIAYSKVEKDKEYETILASYKKLKLRKDALVTMAKEENSIFI